MSGGRWPAERFYREPVWPSGIGGAQCERCGTTTVVRRFPAMDSDFHTDVDGEMLCRACVDGSDNREVSA